jgi:predicted O-methyltransferase YrrM
MSERTMKSLWYTVQDVLRGLPAVSPLSAVVALRQPKLLPVFHANVLRSYRITAGGRAPSVLPHKLIPTSGAVTLRIGEYGLFPGKEADFPILELVALLEPERIFEIGTSTGRRTGLMAMNTSETAKVFTLDLPPDASTPEHASDLHLIRNSKEHVGSHFRDTRWFGTKIIQLFGNSLSFDFSSYDDSIDLVMIDGSHTYEACYSDTFNAFRMVRENGVLLWHDYESERSEYGVNAFVDRLRLHHGCPVVRLSSEWGDTRFAALRVDATVLKQLKHLAAHPSAF